MGNRTTRFVSALVGSIIAGAPLAAVSQNAPNAPTTANAASTADDCLASPKGAAPRGQHWHYRLERTTKRQCWYLRAAGEKDSAKAVQTAQATTDAPTADSAAPQQQAVQDARAEYLTPRGGAASKAPNAVAQGPAPTPAQPSANQPADAQQPTGAAPWPDASTATAPPAPQPAVVAAAAQPSAKPSKSPSPVALAAADSTTDKPTGSVQMLLLVIGGALALAGILASVVYRLARPRVRVQATDRRTHWDDWGPQDHDPSRAPWLGAVPADAPRAPPRPIDFDAARPQGPQLAAFANEIGRIAAQFPSTQKDGAALEKADTFNGEFEIEALPVRLAANDTHHEEPVDREKDIQIEDAVDVDVITAMLERLAKQGPRLPQPSPEADLASLVRSQRDQSAARA